MWKEEEEGQESVRRERFNEAEKTKAEKICTACPFCLTMLRDAGNELNSGLPVNDIAEIIADKLKRLLPAEHKDKVKFLSGSVETGGIAARAITEINAQKELKINVLENIRYAAGEKKGDKALIDQLSSMADVYVIDAFGTVHREASHVLAAPVRIGMSSSPVASLTPSRSRQVR